VETESRQIALYLRSPHLNTILQIPRSSLSLPSLRVSLAQVGSPTGHPVLVFLGLGCVRYLIAQFDELASAFGLRLICIDRWGFGKTGMIDQSERDPMAWATIVDQVLEELGLGVEGYHLLAHSAGTPYAMALAKRFPERVRGRIHLLAPWVSADIDGGERGRGAEVIMRPRNADSVQGINGSNGSQTE
jgi:pimeloyl-ACP methyl ester carboxylesterase